MIEVFCSSSHSCREGEVVPSPLKLENKIQRKSLLRVFLHPKLLWKDWPNILWFVFQIKIEGSDCLPPKCSDFLQKATEFVLHVNLSFLPFGFFWVLFFGFYF